MASKLLILSFIAKLFASASASCTPNDPSIKVTFQKDIRGEQYTTSFYIRCLDEIEENLEPRNRPIESIEVANPPPHLNKKSFANLPFVKKISLENGNIQNVEANAFFNLSDILDIALPGNKLRIIRKDTFNNLPVQGIYLDNNEISNIHPDAFSKLPHLRDLYLQGNQLKNIYANWFLESTNSLRTLDLSDNIITYIESKTFSLLPVNYIFLKNNSISRIDAEAFDQLENLFELDLSYNKLKKIQPGWFHKSTIDYLDISNNQVTTIETNAFISLPVTHIFLQNNNIANINTQAFSNLQRLNLLNISGNRLQRLDLTWFVNSTTKLRDLFLDNNQIETIEPHSLSQFPKLMVLNLTNNRIQLISENAFGSSSLVNILDVSKNNLTDIKFVFTLKHLTNLYMKDNGVMFLDKDAFTAAKNLKYVYLDQNPIKCSCFNEMLTLETNFYFAGSQDPFCVASIEPNCTSQYDWDGARIFKNWFEKKL